MKDGASDAYYGRKALKLSKKYGGKIKIEPNLKIRSLSDFSTVYTPGVAAVSNAIKADGAASYDLTWRWNTIFIVTNGSRVLGLGDIGPLASLPVMEGKSLLYKTLGGVNAVPIPIDSVSPEDFVKVVKSISVTSGGIHLEDLSSPFCFDVLEKLQKELVVPVWHDDQQGTAAATLAGLINSFKIVGKDLKDSRLILVGSGAANLALFNMLGDYGADLGKIVLIDSKGVLSRKRPDLEQMKVENIWKHDVLLRSNTSDLTKIEDAFCGADAVIAFSRPGPGIIGANWIRSMGTKPIVFANSNPTPEIFPSAAKRAGAYIVGTGRSDFPNQINNSLIFPALFRGVLDSRAKRITNRTAIVAAEALAEFARKNGMSKNYIVPKMTERALYPTVAASVAEYCCSSGDSSLKEGFGYFYKKAKKIIG